MTQHCSGDPSRPALYGSFLRSFRRPFDRPSVGRRARTLGPTDSSDGRIGSADRSTSPLGSLDDPFDGSNPGIDRDSTCGACASRMSQSGERPPLPHEAARLAQASAAAEAAMRLTASPAGSPPPNEPRRVSPRQQQPKALKFALRKPTPLAHSPSSACTASMAPAAWMPSEEDMAPVLSSLRGNRGRVRLYVRMDPYFCIVHESVVVYCA